MPKKGMVMCDSDKRQAGAQIEVTPEMVEAGAEVLRCYDENSDPPFFTVVEIIERTFGAAVGRPVQGGGQQNSCVYFSQEVVLRDSSLRKRLHRS